MTRLPLYAPAILGAMLGTTALAQSSPDLTYGQVPTAGQWNSYFASKQDTLNFSPLNRAGGAMTGKLTTVAPTAGGAGLSLPPGVAPVSPGDGDVWTTTGGLFAQISGTTVGPAVFGPAADYLTLFPPGSGARARSLADILSDNVSVLNYCTPAQITTDITTCAQNAINQAAPPNGSYGGKQVFFPAQYTYRLTGTLSLPAFVGLRGEGSQATYITCANGSADCIDIGSSSTSTRDQSIRDMSINGDGAKTGGATVSILNTFNVLLDRVQIESCVVCVDIGPSNNGVTIRDAYMSPKTVNSTKGIYWHAAGDGSNRNDVLSLYNVVIEGNWSNATGLQLDGWVNTLVGASLRILHMQYGIRSLNTAGSASFYPSFFNLFDLELEGFKTRALSIEAGADFKIDGSDINNLSGGDPAQGKADDYAVACYADVGHSNTRGLSISNSRLGNSQNSGLYTECKSGQFGTVQFFSTSLSQNNPSPVRHPVIQVGASAQNNVFTNIVCEEYGGAALASNCINVASGATAVTASDFDISYINDIWYSDLGNAMTWNAAKGGFGTFNPSVDGAVAGLRVDQNGITNFKIANGVIGSSTQSRVDWSTGTANSYAIGTLADNNGAPTFGFSFGSAVTSTFWNRLLTLPGIVVTQATPSSSSASCTAGQIASDATYIYACTASNTWKRVSLSAF